MRGWIIDCAGDHAADAPCRCRRHLNGFVCGGALAAKWGTKAHLKWHPHVYSVGRCSHQFEAAAPIRRVWNESADYAHTRTRNIWVLLSRSPNNTYALRVSGGQGSHATTVAALGDGATPEYERRVPRAIPT